ncbi:MAG: hypothetical protein AAFZ15_03375 [Bacteroidota bacterium]
MNHISFILLFVLYLVPSWLLAQQNPIDKAASDIVKEILVTIGRASDSSHIKVQRSDQTMTAKATFDNQGRRVILFNQDFLTDFNASGTLKQRAYFILGHEVAHHIHEDNFDEMDVVYRRNIEIRADSFAGGLMFRLCISPEEVGKIFEELPPDATGIYLTQRMIAVSKGHDTEKKLWEKVNKNPCDGEKMEPSMSLQRRFRSNHSQGVYARVFHDSILIRYNLYQDNVSNEFEGRFVVSDKAQAAPTIKHFKWLDDPGTFGAGKKAVWHFKKDGFAYADVFNGDNFGLAVFEGQAPPSPKNWQWWVGGALAIGGAALLAKGIPDRIEAQDGYDEYKRITNPNTYESIRQKTREAALEELNDLKRTSEIQMTIGSGLFALGGYIILNNNKKRRNYPKGVFLFKGTR